ncbi:ribosome maturation factor RimM [Oceanospirillum beijerinckii]|uniref:ribosome maturation factor RimM n=1 Tax=Oceanospirillum beijerinckii TaxID=64976 RepID=UPI0003FADFF1|nr:ribosome maturation factor RimM [Oceanospirillum beijerinckii]
MSDQKENFVVLGKITSPFGLQGWVKVYSYTDPMDGLFQYKKWSLWRDGKPVGEFVLSKGQKHSKGLIARLKAVENRNQSEALAGTEIRISKDQLPDLEDGDYYWHQLEGLTVITIDGVNLGQVDYLIDTGANDVVVVKASTDSIDDNERLLPYLLDQVVKEIDLSAGTMLVDWDPDF